MSSKRKEQQDKIVIDSNKEKILLFIDDDRTVIEATKYILEEIGCKVVSAYNGEDAINIINETTPDIILMDVNMPNMTGYELCRILRKKKKTKRIPIIMLTGKIEIEDELKGFEYGADDYITKPFNFEILKSRIKVALEKERKEEENILSAGNIKVDLDSREIFIGKELIELRPKEYAVLIYLIRKKGKIVHREELNEKVWNFDDIMPHAIDETVRSLREKMGAESWRLLTIKRVGYKLKYD